jgi:hypothetical protein
VRCVCERDDSEREIRRNGLLKYLPVLSGHEKGVERYTHFVYGFSSCVVPLGLRSGCTSG